MPSPVVPLPGVPVPVPPANPYYLFISPGVANAVTHTSIITRNNLPIILYATSDLIAVQTGILELTIAPAWLPIGTNAPFTAGSVGYLDLALQGGNPVLIASNFAGCSYPYYLVGTLWANAATLASSCSNAGGRTVVTPPGSTSITAGTWVYGAVRTADPYAVFGYFDGTGQTFGTNIAAIFTTPITGMDMAVDPSGEVWVATVGSGSVSVFRTISTGTPGSSSWAFDGIASTAVITNARNNIKLIMTSTTEGYLAFQDITSNFLSVAKRTNAGWSLLGGPNISGGAITVTRGASIAMAVDASGTPYVAYADTALGDKMTIQKWTGSAWQVLFAKGVTSGGVKALGMASSVTDLIFVYGDAGNGDTLTVGGFPI
jgi:hypothetical protein